MWQPSSSIEALTKRAELLAGVRQFFADRNVMELDVPVMGRRGVTDLHLDCVEAKCQGEVYFLQTSPEYFLKRLLAAGTGDCYCLGKAFREGEVGPRHNPEFTLLEWYRLDWDEHRLMDEVAELIRSVAGKELPVSKSSYQQLFEQQLGINPHATDLATLQKMAAQASGHREFREDFSTCLDLLFSLGVEPKLPDGLVLVYDYPACQAALAKQQANEAGQLVARRFEVFLNRMELANGYCELTCAEELQQRFASDRKLRQLSGKKDMKGDEKLLQAMEHGLPECAGVALGVDRLLMQILGATSISSVLPFDHSQL